MEASRRCKRIRALLPQEPISGPLRLYLRFPLREMPLRRASIFRALYKVIPMVKWEECTNVEFICQGALAESLEQQLRKGVRTLMGCEPWILLEDPRTFRNVTRMEITLTQIGNLPEDVTIPGVSRVKVLCKDAAFADGALDRIEKVFPAMKRLHLQLLPSGLLPLCLPGFVATDDCRISLRQGTTSSRVGYGRESNMFLVAHLLTLPFTWKGSFFARLRRFQMDELNEKPSGMTMQNMAEALKGAPLLQRLGSVSMNFLELLDPAREECQLEEVVVCMEIEDCLRLFNLFSPLYQQQRRCSIKRLGIHFRAPDGVSKASEEVERVLLSGWCFLAGDLLAPNGFVMFSQGQTQLFETAFFQLPFLDPCHFSLDVVDYGEQRVAVSTPISLPLRYNEPLANMRPRGTLVSGPMRPSSTDDYFEEARTLPSSPFSPVQALEGTKAALTGKRSSLKKTTRQPELSARDAMLSSLSIQFADVTEYLSARKEELFFN